MTQTEQAYVLSEADLAPCPGCGAEPLALHAENCSALTAPRTEGGERKAQDGAEPFGWISAQGLELIAMGGPRRRAIVQASRDAEYNAPLYLQPPGLPPLTREMLNAAVDATGAGYGMSWVNRSPQTLFEQGWYAMLAAARAHPAPLQSGLPSVEEMARTIGDTFSPNLTFDRSSRATQLACRRAATAVCALIGQAQAPEGFVLVPREPTEAMLSVVNPSWRAELAANYRAMLAASAKATEGGEG